MGKALSVLNKHYYRFNAENRAHRMIAKDKPLPAPRHPSTIQHTKSTVTETEDFMTNMGKKDLKFDENLKKVFIKSYDPIHIAKQANFGKPSEKARLPANRSTPVDDELGYIEPDVVPEGKITLKQAMSLLTEFQENPQINNANVLSEKYKLSLEDTDKILRYFSNFKVYLPEPSEEKSKVTKILKSTYNVKEIEAKNEIQ